MVEKIRVFRNEESSEAGAKLLAAFAECSQGHAIKDILSAASCLIGATIIDMVKTADETSDDDFDIMDGVAVAVDQHAFIVEYIAEFFDEFDDPDAIEVTSGGDA